jgi:mediator of RNA polymerase II transcription subunit 12
VYIVDSKSRGMSLADVVGAPYQSRVAIHTALLAETTTPLVHSALSGSGIILARALPYTSPPRRCMVLTGPNIPNDGIHDPSIPLDDRPWELFDQIAPTPPISKHGELFLTSKSLRDTASVSLSMFNPTIKRDSIPISASQVEEDERGYEAYASERNLGDGLAGEPMIAKTLATGLFQAEVKEEIERSGNDGRKSGDASPSTLPSELVNRPRRSSTRIATASSRAVSGSNTNPISIDVDDSPEEEEEEEEEAEEHVGKRAKTGGKSTRKTYGGKAPAKSTVARKTTGGKSLGRKGVAAKAPRGGRRRGSVVD